MLLAKYGGVADEIAEPLPFHAEPYYLPPTVNWVGSMDGLVTSISLMASGVPPLTTIARGRGYVAVSTN